MAPKIGFLGFELDLEIKQGSTFGPINVTANNPDGSVVNLTGCLIRGQIRRKALNADPFVASFDTSIVDAANGLFTFGLSYTVTAAIAAGEFIKSPESLYQYDIEMVDSTGLRVIPLLYGKAFVFREVTR
jgi:hypothetical protein